MPGFALGGLALYVVSRLDRAPSAEVLARYAAAETILKDIREGKSTGEVIGGGTDAPVAQPSP